MNGSKEGTHFDEYPLVGAQVVWACSRLRQDGLITATDRVAILDAIDLLRREIQALRKARDEFLRERDDCGEHNVVLFEQLTAVRAESEATGYRRGINDAAIVCDQNAQKFQREIALDDYNRLWGRGAGAVFASAIRALAPQEQK